MNPATLLEYTFYMGGNFGPRLTICLPLNPLCPGQDSCHTLQELLNDTSKWLLDVTMKASVLDLKYRHAQLTLLSMTHATRCFNTYSLMLQGVLLRIHHATRCF